jgi:hypothetical protein
LQQERWWCRPGASLANAGDPVPWLAVTVQTGRVVFPGREVRSSSHRTQGKA